VSHSIGTDSAKRLVPDYVDKLCEEIAFTGRKAMENGLVLTTVYWGGGTPTTLTHEQLDRVLSVIEESFDLSSCREYTVEAGRPDTITKEKLQTLKNHGVNRISINPQTFNNSVLEAVGRRHTAEDTIKIFDLARKIGIDNINMDLIAGLPSDTVQGFCYSLDTAMSLDPENITVHTLAVKRSSTIGQNSPKIATENASRLPIGKKLHFEKKDIKDFKKYSERGTVICNPPYGERLLDLQEAEDIYRQMGRVFDRQHGWSYYVITPDEEFENCFGRKADKQRKLYNGMIKCRLYMYFK
jgi:oxygen-independent coproporphyrinogen-3 oxidase